MNEKNPTPPAGADGSPAARAEDIALARRLLADAPDAALAVLDDSGHPFVSRVLVATDRDGTPFLFVSALSHHTRALIRDGRCSLLVTETGKGDPLAHPRLTLQAMAAPVARDAPERDRLRQYFLDRHPKSALYIDFQDFLFIRLMPIKGHLVAGFGSTAMLTAHAVLNET
ncbi:hypothetical protein BJF92_06830 [Rhizobium rhizosphaerae]|uniref:CREG-like beta-barrel domain-containing protein n=1 Tax=Xaviernesmea rhizosphaerae TaxID=1672749 RepID=A0A1Q9AP87_9HYPH|nr:pyridoxamine 5'-phosphate oxidase family protein [Xaviernesmea rhizosphaerae]OLP57233.1 hypothetical protein BJF92_06830 [Xaviernesmea rhizosphaerae]OQP87663.1 hypothetical protein BTR14_03610 [Xaviernesmea rhizosphaerae]